MSIEERPNEMENRLEFGHCEIDTIVGKKETSAVLLTLDERKTKKRHIVKIDSRSSENVEQGVKKIADIYSNKFHSVFKSITSNNGSRFAKLTSCFTDIPIYYAHPYSSFEWGTNEKQNSLVRRFLPKAKSFDDISDDTIAFIEDWINNLPRKLFNYLSSAELFNSVLFHIAI